MALLIHTETLKMFLSITILFPICSFSLQTIWYGGSNGLTQINIFDQGRINGITSWGYETTHNGIIIESWTSDNKSNSDRIGIDTITNTCTPFTISNANDYIDWVEIKFESNDYVRELTFHVSNSNSYTCSIDPTYYSTLTNIKTKRIQISNTYLTGFKFRYGGIIDAIGFQFTNFNNLITLSDMYGGTGGNTYFFFDQGRINAISYWGYKYTSWNSIIIIDWLSDAQTNPIPLGFASWIEVNCTKFSLTSNQYIDGYRILHSTRVSSIGFQINDGTKHECQVSPLPSGLTDTGWITVYPPSYLSGIWANTGTIIDAIILQFTAVSLTCPPGSEQVGGIETNNDISGCGLDICSERLDTINEVECRDKCIGNINCKAFNFAPKNGDEDYANNIVCTLYDSDEPNRSWGYQIFCRIITSNPTTVPTINPTELLICPNGSIQIGSVTTNNDITTCGLGGCDGRYDTNNAIECRNKCLSNNTCIAFNYAPLNGDANHLDKIVCSLYDSNIPIRSWGYQIFCKIITLNPTLNPTLSPITNQPTTNAPTTNEPTTTMPTTIEPTTGEPTTNEPSTYEPTTFEPTTQQPTTKEGEVPDYTTTYDIMYNSENDKKNQGELNNNGSIYMDPLFIISGIVLLLIFCICCLVIVYIKTSKKRKRIRNEMIIKNETIEMNEKIAGVSVNENNIFNTLTTNNTLGEQENDISNNNSSPQPKYENELESDDSNDDDGMYNTNEITTNGGDIDNNTKNGELQINTNIKNNDLLYGHSQTGGK